MSDVSVNYCYRCGRPIGHGAGKCIFCGVPARREIRPPRRCPFCDEPVRPKALKCHHCGEFLDGRPSDKLSGAEKEPAAPAIHIEQAIVQTGEGGPQVLGIPSPPQAPGGALDPPAAAALPPPPGQALPEPPKGLPAPEGASGGTQYGSQTQLGQTVQPGSKELIPTGEQTSTGDTLYAEQVGGAIEPGKELAVTGGNLPASPMRTAAKAGASMVPALFRAIGKGIQAIPKVAGRGSGDLAIDVETDREEDRYRVCEVCGTEILALDNFCFHCGQKYSTERGKAPPKLAHGAPVIHSLAVALLLAIWFAPGALLSPIPDAAHAPTRIGILIAAPALALWGLFRCRGFMWRGLAIIILAGCVLGSIHVFVNNDLPAADSEPVVEQPEQ